MDQMLHGRGCLESDLRFAALKERAQIAARARAHFDTAATAGRAKLPLCLSFRPASAAMLAVVRGRTFLS